MTSSYFSKFLRKSKLRASTFSWAFSSALFTQGWMIASPSSRPSLRSIPSIRSEPKIRIKSSSRLRKNFEAPGSPCRPDRPRNWLSIRRLSWRSVPMMISPPDVRTLALSSLISDWIFMALISSTVLLGAVASIATRISRLPPNWISVPRPAMLVAMVRAPTRPA